MSSKHVTDYVSRNCIVPRDQYIKESNEIRAERYKKKFRSESEVVAHLNHYRDAGENFAIFATKSLSYEIIKKFIKNGYKVSRSNNSNFTKVEWQ